MDKTPWIILRDRERRLPFCVLACSLNHNELHGGFATEGDAQSYIDDYLRVEFSDYNSFDVVNVTLSVP